MSENNPLYDLLNDSETKKKLLGISGGLSSLAASEEGKSIQKQFGPDRQQYRQPSQARRTNALKGIVSGMLSPRRERAFLSCLKKCLIVD